METARVMKGLKKTLHPGNIFVNISLIVISMICLLPFVWSVSSSLKGRDELFQLRPSLLPRHPTLGNYQWIFTRRDMSQIPLNT
jgi:ABC-type glycerol-3-phosphate transport system permease component